MQKLLKLLLDLNALEENFSPKKLCKNLKEKWELKFRMEIVLQPELQQRWMVWLEHKILIFAIAMLEGRRYSPEKTKIISSSQSKNKKTGF